MCVFVCVCMCVFGYLKNRKFQEDICIFFNLLILFLHMCYICVCFQLVAFIREHICRMTLLMGYSMRFELGYPVKKPCA